VSEPPPKKYRYHLPPKFFSPPIPLQKPSLIDLNNPVDRHFCVYIQYLSGREMTLLRDYEIKDALIYGIKRDATGRYTVSTLDFVSELELLN
jgi:hypothetical protein